MVFDEYDYLEKTVESLKDRTRNELDRDSKPSGTEMEYPRDAFRHRERSPSRLRETSSSRYWEPSSSRHREPSSSRILEGSSSRHRSSLDYRSWDGDRELHHSGRDNRDDRVRDWDRDHSGRDNRDDRVRDWDREREKAKERERLERERLEKEKENERLERDNRDDWVRDWDREREKAKERERLERDRLEKENEKERERLEKEKEKENEKEREKEKEKERERERERERSRRSRSHSERHREEERERERREKSRELRERESDRESRRFKESKEVAEPEADPERDQRTVFAFQITLKADERDVYDFFSRAGKVRDVRLIMDRNSRRSKGVGYIEFYDALSVPMAIALSGQLLLGQPVMVKPSEAEKNLVQSNTTIGGANGLGPYSGGARRLYVGNLHFNMTEEQLRLVFEPFGPVEMVQLPRDLVTGFCKGYGFIQFQRLEDARAAIHLNGQLEIAGRSIKVSAVTDQVGLPEVGANTGGDLDDDEGGGLSLNACSRALLMQKLDRTGTVTSIPGVLLPPVGNAPVLTPAAPVLAVAPPVLGVPRAVSPLTPAAPVLVVPRAVSPILLAPAIVPPVVPATAQPPVVPATAQLVDNVGIPSECLLLKNMFDPTVETEPDFDLDIKEDAEVECAKHGTVKHIFVDKNSAGHVYLRFDSTSSAMSAQRALNGRWFAGNTITAIFLTPQNYEARFPSSS